MDLFGPRAIPALVALALCASAAHAACEALDGTYADESTEKPEGTARSLTEFAPQRERAKLFRSESPPASKGGFTSSAPRARPKVTRLASAVRVKHEDAKVTLAYLDGAGKVLAQAPISPMPSAWKCVADRLERRFETIGGLGERVRTERTEQVLLAAPNGDLGLVETTKIVEVPGAPRRTEVRFKRLAAPTEAPRK